MLKVISRSAALARTQLGSRLLPAFSTTTPHLQIDPTRIVEAPKIENDSVLSSKEQKPDTIAVPTKVDLSPITGVPDEHIKGRKVRIYQPTKNAMQSGTNNIQHWEMEFDTRQRWENPLMGWTSSGDPLSNMKVQFSNPEEAIEHCEKNGWLWYIDVPKIEKDYKPKNYGLNFHWNRRTRVSTK